MEAITRWIHLLGLATYFGTTLGLALQLLPAAEAVDDSALHRRLLARWLRSYNVLSIGALGVLVLSGASSLTEWKALLGRDFARLLWRLVAKLSLTFALILVATYVSFGLAHRLVRAELGQLPVDAPAQAGMIRRMRTCAWLGHGPPPVRRPRAERQGKRPALVPHGTRRHRVGADNHRVHRCRPCRGQRIDDHHHRDAGRGHSRCQSEPLAAGAALGDHQAPQAAQPAGKQERLARHCR